MLCAFKIGIPILILLIRFKRDVISKLPRSYTYDIDPIQRDELKSKFVKEGALLYLAIPVCYYTGAFRLLSSTHFTKEVGLGFGIEIFFTLALIFI